MLYSTAFLSLLSLAKAIAVPAVLEKRVGSGTQADPFIITANSQAAYIFPSGTTSSPGLYYFRSPVTGQYAISATGAGGGSGSGSGALGGSPARSYGVFTLDPGTLYVAVVGGKGGAPGPSGGGGGGGGASAVYYADSDRRNPDTTLIVGGGGGGGGVEAGAKGGNAVEFEPRFYDYCSGADNSGYQPFNGATDVIGDNTGSGGGGSGSCGVGGGAAASSTNGQGGDSRSPSPASANTGSNASGGIGGGGGGGSRTGGGGGGHYGGTAGGTFSAQGSTPKGAGTGGSNFVNPHLTFRNKQGTIAAQPGQPNGQLAIKFIS